MIGTIIQAECLFQISILLFIQRNVKRKVMNLS